MHWPRFTSIVALSVVLGTNQLNGQVGFLSSQDSLAVSFLMNCEECDSQELETVVSMGQAAVPILANILINGPSSERLSREEASLASLHARRSDYARTHPDARAPRPLDEFTQDFIQNMVATWRIRAALSLGHIGGADAGNALESAIVLPLREDVIRAVEFARDSLWTP